MLFVTSCGPYRGDLGTPDLRQLLNTILSTLLHQYLFVSALILTVVEVPLPESVTDHQTQLRRLGMQIPKL